MAQIDSKKLEHAEERHGMAEDIVAIRNLKQVKQVKKDELISGLLDEKYKTQSPLECPYPENEEYLYVWNKLKPKEQADMKANIKISEDGKIEMVKMHKKFSILTAEPNEEKSIIKYWDYTYFTPKAAAEECDNKGKKLLKDNPEVADFISHFPWKDHEDKIRNFFRLFGLIKTGTLGSGGSLSYRDTSYVILSRVNADGNASWLLWDPIFSSGHCTHVGVDSYQLQPVISYEDC